MSERFTDEQVFEKVENLLVSFRSEFVDYFGPVEQTTRARLLRIYEVWRQVSLRRIVDLGDSALWMFKQGRLVPGCILTRGVFESVGVQYYIHKKMLEFTSQSNPEAIHTLLIQAMFGQKDQTWTESPIQVLTAIDHMDKEFNGSRNEYDHLWFLAESCG